MDIVRYCLFFLIIVAVCNGATEPIRVEIGRDFARTNALRVDNQSASGSDSMALLSKAITSRGRETNVSVMIPESLRFTDWNNVRGLLEKVGFLNIRYFVYSPSSKMMIEIRQEGNAVPLVN